MLHRPAASCSEVAALKKRSIEVADTNIGEVPQACVSSTAMYKGISTGKQNAHHDALSPRGLYWDAPISGKYHFSSQVLCLACHLTQFSPSSGTSHIGLQYTLAYVEQKGIGGFKGLQALPHLPLAPLAPCYPLLLASPPFSGPVLQDLYH